LDSEGIFELVLAAVAEDEGDRCGDVDGAEKEGQFR